MQLPHPPPEEAVALASTEEEPLPAPIPLEPFSPVRSSPTDYSWKRSPQSDCRAFGSLGLHRSPADFPLPPVDPAGLVEAPDTWGTGSPPSPAERRSPGNAEQVVAALRPHLRRCLSSWMESGSTSEGSVRFAVQIDCSGRVSALSAKSSGVDELTVGCLFGVVAQAAFASPASGQSTLQIPVVFKSAER